MEVICCSFEKHEKLLILRDIGKKVHSLILCLSTDNKAILQAIQRSVTEAKLIICAQHHGVHI